MNLEEELKDMHRNLSESNPEMAVQFDADAVAMVRSGIGSAAPRQGDPMPEFTLPDPTGAQVSSGALLANGPLVISFYRGGWCPYCNLELRALQEILPELNACGASLVAISPQRVEESFGTSEANGLGFPLLSDEGNQVARQFGLVFAVSHTIRPLYAEVGIDLPAKNGDESFELPVPATFVVSREGTLLAAQVSADYTLRMTPEMILRILRAG